MRQTDDGHINSLTNISVGNIFSSDEVSNTIFWSLFRNDKFGIALSDANGNVSLANSLFSLQFSKDGRYEALHDFLDQPHKKYLRPELDLWRTHV